MDRLLKLFASVYGVTVACVSDAIKNSQENTADELDELSYLEMSDENAIELTNSDEWRSKRKITKTRLTKQADEVWIFQKVKKLRDRKRY